MGAVWWRVYRAGKDIRVLVLIALLIILFIVIVFFFVHVVDVSLLVFAIGIRVMVLRNLLSTLFVILVLDSVLIFVYIFVIMGIFFCTVFPLLLLFLSYLSKGVYILASTAISVALVVIFSLVLSVFPLGSRIGGERWVSCVESL